MNMQGRSKVLVVDDEAHILHVVSMKLANAGYDVLTAEDGQEAFDLASNESPDLVITDYQMPFMNGIELCQRLRETKATAALPCVMLTARGYRLEGKEIERTNILAVLHKPFSPRELLQRVDEVLRRERAA